MTSQEKCAIHFSTGSGTTPFFAAKERAKTGLHSNYISIGYVPKDLNAAMRLIEGAKPAYLITLSEESQLSEEYQTQTPSYLNVISLPVLKFVRQDPRFTRYSFQSKNGLVVFQFAPGSQTIEMGWVQSHDTAQFDGQLAVCRPKSLFKATLGDAGIRVVTDEPSQLTQWQQPASAHTSAWETVSPLTAFAALRAEYVPVTIPTVGIARTRAECVNLQSKAKVHGTGAIADAEERIAQLPRLIEMFKHKSKAGIPFPDSATQN